MSQKWLIMSKASTMLRTFCQYFKIMFNYEYVKFLIDFHQISFIIRHAILSTCISWTNWELIRSILTCVPTKYVILSNEVLATFITRCVGNCKQHNWGRFLVNEHLRNFPKMHNTINYVSDRNWLFLDGKFNYAWNLDLLNERVKMD